MVCGSQVNGKFCFDTGGAGRQDENAIGEADSFCKIVGDEDDGFFCLTDHGSNIGGNGQPGLVIQRGKRLIEQQDIGLERHRADEGSPLAHAAGKLRRLLC